MSSHSARGSWLDKQPRSGEGQCAPVGAQRRELGSGQRGHRTQTSPEQPAPQSQQEAGLAADRLWGLPPEHAPPHPAMLLVHPPLPLNVSLRALAHVSLLPRRLGPLASPPTCFPDSHSPLRHIPHMRSHPAVASLVPQFSWLPALLV